MNLLKKWNQKAIKIGRYEIAYRGFGLRRYRVFSLRPISIGSTRLYTLWFVGLFVNAKEKR